MPVARLLAAAALLLAAGTAGADVRAVSLDAVYDPERCSGDPCSGAKGKLAAGDVVDGPIEVALSAEADIALRWVRLEARADGQEAWYCVQRWEPATPEMEGRYTWDTKTWPLPSDSNWRCRDNTDPNHGHGEPTRNTRFELRVLAQDISGDEVASEPFALRFNNPPAPPLWRRGASLEEGASAPAVALSWYAAREPDLRAYVLERDGPDGKSRIVIDGGDPSRQGCATDAETSEILCRDTGFRPEGSGGTYTYRMTTQTPAVRGGVRCATGAGRCLVSPAGESRSAKIPGAFVPPERSPDQVERSPRAGRERTSRPGRREGSRKKADAPEEPGGLTLGQAPPPGRHIAAASDRERQGFIAAAAALLTLAAVRLRGVVRGAHRTTSST